MGELLEGIRRLRAGDWEAAHAIAQRDATRWGAWLHGIVHLVEGDAGNARYWYAQTGRHCPGVEQVEAELVALESEIAA